MTIVHTKTPQRYHARVIALNQMVALSVLSAGFLLAPLAGSALEPLLRPTRLSTFDRDEPDDVVGLAALTDRGATRG